MSQIEEAIREHEERCELSINSRLVSWKWLITIVAGFLVTLITTAWSLSSSTTEAKVKLNQYEKRLIEVENTYKEMYKDIKFIRGKFE
jgi:membrane protein implicated in regulation of membrane protease activity